MALRSPEERLVQWVVPDASSPQAAEQAGHRLLRDVDVGVGEQQVLSAGTATRAVECVGHTETGVLVVDLGRLGRHEQKPDQLAGLVAEIEDLVERLSAAPVGNQDLAVVLGAQHYQVTGVFVDHGGQSPGEVTHVAIVAPLTDDREQAVGEVFGGQPVARHCVKRVADLPGRHTCAPVGGKTFG